MSTTLPIALECSECGTGNYRRHLFFWACTNPACDHEITTADIDLEAGEILTTDASGHLAYVPADD